MFIFMFLYTYSVLPSPIAELVDGATATNNRIIRGNTTVNEYDVMRPDGTTSHRSTYSKDNLPFDCFCVRDTVGE